jgi:hypothetical protein
MALIQLNTRYRRLIVFLFFASLLIVALKPTGVTYLCVAIASLFMITIPCGQRFINDNKTLWIIRELYFAALTTAWLLWAIKTW